MVQLLSSVYIGAARLRAPPLDKRPTLSMPKALLEPSKTSFGALQSLQCRTAAKKIHVHKQVVQRKAGKNTPEINHLFSR